MSIYNRLFKRDNVNNRAASMNIEAAHRIIRDYESFLQTSAPLPGCVADVKQLPHAKEQIKDAIGVYINTAREEAVTEELRHGYLMLSAWQSDVGDQTLGLDFTQLDLDEDPMLLAEIIQQQSAIAERWKPVIETDQDELMSEFEWLTA